MNPNALLAPSDATLFEAIRSLDATAVRTYLQAGGNPAARSNRGASALADLLLTYRAVKADIPKALAARARASDPDAFAAGPTWGDGEDDDDLNQQSAAPPASVLTAAPARTDEEVVEEFLRDLTLGIAEDLFAAGAPNLETNMGATRYSQTIGSFAKANLADIYPALLAYHERHLLGAGPVSAPTSNESSAGPRHRIV